MTTRRKVPGVRNYDGPAGGWGALKATATAVREQMDTLKAPITLMRTNQPDGFDCPGCAWPDKEHKSTFQFCENGAKAVTWEATNKRVTPDFFANHPVASLLHRSDYELEDLGRITHPLVYDRASDTYQPVEWEAAFARIGEILRGLPPEQVEFYTSGRASNEAAYLYQLFIREYGSNNFPDCSNMCHEPTSVGLPRSIGIGKGTVSLDDFDACELIISIGHNPGTNHPRMMGTLHEASRRKVPIMVFNPLRERALERFADPQNMVEMATYGSTRIASSYFQVKAGGDAAAIKGIMKALLELEQTVGKVLDHDFIAQHTRGFDELVADLHATAWPDIEQASGLHQVELEKVAAAYAKSNATIVTYGMGITQHNEGTANVRLICDLLMLRGNFGKPGAGICPLRGHSNVQGNRTVGITEKPSKDFLDRLEKVFGFKPPAAHGHDSVKAMQAMIAGTAKALICLGGNFAVALPDPGQCFPAMGKLDLSVHIGTKLNRSHLLVAKESYLFPCLGRTELDVQDGMRQSITVEDSMSMVHASAGKLTPASEFLRSEPAIVAGIAQSTLPDTKVPWQELVADYDKIRDLIEKTVPGFEAFNQRIRVPGGFRMPLPPTERIWLTPSGKAEFFVFPGLHEDKVVDGADVLRLITIRSHDQYNTTIYAMDDRYRGVFGRRDVLFMNQADLDARGLAHGDLVDIETVTQGRKLRYEKITAIEYKISPGSVAAYYPEANQLVPLDYIDVDSGTPSYKSVPVRIVRSALN
ncbi:oxidoreductase alpha (molybdopterin) subunit [Pseudomonas chlororaphis]|uniref:FdhF/YdeP family oxidoreductase n=1 Tax=Pseudomonas chlororaphis TaxID=587753 RepID=UPI00087D931D|nr:FdhF/YdeP family oxidoreductase [Pseudomonas chlororaphis]AZD49299.1 Putative formate dehydrogenase oxidoreductase protein [Pseudomonas chlororaphis subsp. aurantiaca]AZD68053.1 Putative formate dehydrogenase oxidoreductase protein [Pseudomonas chlororaphis subsp. aurantiaca]AZD74250.1 Putative formate dehydrogenase oxidoreductase protein [Pseudomonas chlororaphis subsp. aurantiaca]AZD80422.1 Putative formate dehydrogenase oxidoreductase protein [Pseudomonas chlororaphis subsp. aurantiaca]Q